MQSAGVTQEPALRLPCMYQSAITPAPASEIEHVWPRKGVGMGGAQDARFQSTVNRLPADHPADGQQNPAIQMKCSAL